MRPGLIALVLLFLFGAAYDFVKEGSGSLSGLQGLLVAVSIVALAPTEDQPTKRRSIWSALQSPQYLAGAVASVAALGMFVYRVARDIGHR